MGLRYNLTQHRATPLRERLAEARRRCQRIAWVTRHPYQRRQHVRALALPLYTWAAAHIDRTQAMICALKAAVRGAIAPGRPRTASPLLCDLMAVTYKADVECAMDWAALLRFTALHRRQTQPTHWDLQRQPHAREDLRQQLAGLQPTLRRLGLAYDAEAATLTGPRGGGGGVCLCPGVEWHSATATVA